MKLKFWKYNRTRRKETRIKETFGYKKRFHFSTFILDKLLYLQTLYIHKTTEKRNYG